MSDSLFRDRPLWGLSEYRQTKRIYELEDELASQQAVQRHTVNRLQSQMSKLTGSIEQRLNRLTQAFDAFVEMSDVRLQLAVYDVAAAVRLRAKQVIVGVASDQDVPDVDGYWLVPALRALNAWRAGRDAAPLLAEAATVDAQRATLFHALTSAQFGRGDAVTAEQLTTAFGALGEKVTLAQRALWTLAADGHYGVAGRQTVQRLLGPAVARLDENQREQQVTRWCKAVHPDAPARKLPNEHQGSGLGARLDAGDRLAVLRSWLTGMLADRPERTAEPDETARRALELLVDEGSPAEAPLLARERELRKIIENSGERAQTWDEPVGEPLAMLIADVEDEAHPERAAVAVHVSGPLVLAAAEQLAATAGESVPTELKVRGRRGAVVVTRSGPDMATVDKSVAGLAEYEVQRSGRKQQRNWALAAGVVFLALGFAGWGLALIAVIPLVAAGYFHVADRRARAGAVELEARTRTAVLADAEEQAQRFMAVRAELEKRRPSLADDVTAIKSLVG
ncbi:hypothetical protein [Labedaea rhizosphaerae]|uniref:Uncharacterized protein n=1 Tax=Labedaea rhizosphaerae TaxID=598644 RepID=A0A4R6SIZ7_LABRH|nr:hypothetical protein [Labedaea rhizosphaerae]TDQ04276.1 hypothetical protein EV186_101219 [Labedaea rhizosphaerae]